LVTQIYHEALTPVCVHASALHGFSASPLAFISHERKQVVIHYLKLHFPTQFM